MVSFAEATEKSHAAQLRREIAMTSARQKVVVAVDDAEDVLQIVKGLLTFEGYRFIGASSGEYGLALIQRVAPDLILLDIRLPDLDGFALCHRIRALPSCAKTPIVFMSVCKAPQDIRAAIDAGANDYIVKPFDAKTLVSRAARWTACVAA